MRKLGWFIVASGIGVAIACGSSTSGDDTPAPVDAGGPGDDGGGGGNAFADGTAGDGGGADTGPAAKACTVDQDCGDGGACNPATKTCGCGGQKVDSTVVPPNLIIALDRSCSMTDLVGGGKTKWDIAVAAIQDLLTKEKGKIHFGIELFPDTTGDRCTQDAIAIPVAPGNETAIATLLGDALSDAGVNYPDGPCVTNIDTGMSNAATNPALANKKRKSFVILLTDGKQSAVCGDGGGDAVTTSTITSLRAQGVDTFVIGFGSGVDVTQMNTWADAGGEPSGGATLFFDAADQASLEAALKAIATKTLSCVLDLASPPPGNDPGLIFVFAGTDPTPLTRDTTHAGGWDYDDTAQTVTLFGAQCDALKSGATDAVNVVYGCPGGPPPANPVK